MTITLINTFHGTAITLHTDASCAYAKISDEQMARARRKLCPSHSSGCACGGNAGERGGDYTVDADGGVFWRTQWADLAIANFDMEGGL